MSLIAGGGAGADRFTDGNTLLRGLAVLMGALVGLTLVLYGVDELCPLPHLVPRQRRPCGEMIYAPRA